MWAPWTHVFSDDQGNYLYTAYGLISLFAKFNFDEISNEIEILANLNGGTILAAHTFDGVFMTVNFEQTYYTKNGWETLNLTGHYRKTVD